VASACPRTPGPVSVAAVPPSSPSEAPPEDLPAHRWPRLIATLSGGAALAPLRVKWLRVPARGGCAGPRRCQADCA
jgi:hypothetical protein